ncbi:MAG: methylmalonyl Co-A mutase-associated GTPase MeaB [Nitriliruptor sp.]|uniref:methylmalonyl Co-A mutase-associated GTPase MeaB n=1 Tax=Nitriliruptor sp. TaxID=2448056 RepID=UPI0034A08A9A
MAQTVDDLVQRLARGERRALARLLTLVEDGAPGQLREVVAALHPRTGSARVLGITGSPGVGKSTLTNAIAAELRSRDRSVAVLAVDPSSPFSGGALLGDRVRMQGHHADPDVFIRSMASRGHLGGLSFATPQAVLVLDAAGFDDVIVETVGVGQSEVQIAATADTTVVAMAPGMGDSVQAAKAGILEVADVFVINKADASGAGKLESELRGMLELGRATAGRSTAELLDEHPDLLDHHPELAPPVGGDPELADDLGGGSELVPGSAAAGWWPPILRTVAVRGEGITELVDAFDDHDAHLAASGRADARARDRALHTIREIALEQVRSRFVRLDEHHSSKQRGQGGDPLLDALATRVAEREIDPYAAADELLEALEGGPA